MHADEPELRATGPLVDVLSAGLAAAVRRAYASVDLERPFVVEVRGGGDRPLLPGWVRIGSQRFRDRMRELSSTHGETLPPLFKGEESGEVVLLELGDHCDPETLTACREVNAAMSLQRGSGDPEKQRARAALDSVGARVTQALNDGTGFPGHTDPFLVLVGIADPYGRRDDPLAMTRRELGEARTRSFIASVASRVDPDAQIDLHAARRDRGALERWLRDRGLGERARGLAQRVAAPGLRLVPVADDRTTGRSRLGGDGLLPPGERWPRTIAGRPLSFLAGVDLAEMPRDLPGTEVLPPAGWMLFFADLDDGGEALGFVGEPTRNDPGADARLLWAAPDVEPLAAEPPADLPREPHVRMVERRVAGRSQLTLPDGYDSARGLGLDFAEAEAYDEIAAALRYGRRERTGGDVRDEPDDWVLGGVTGVQGSEAEGETVLLLRLASIEFQDGGAIQFRIGAEALAEREWSGVVAGGDSH